MIDETDMKMKNQIHETLLIILINVVGLSFYRSNRVPDPGLLAMHADPFSCVDKMKYKQVVKPHSVPNPLLLCHLHALQV
jgi:hypothetical protein